MQENKHRIAGWMMTFSMILLTGFVGYWLSGQYQEQKAILYRSMSHELFSSREAVMDSVIMQKIKPLLLDSLRPSGRMIQSARFDTRADTTSAIVMDYTISTDQPAIVEGSEIHVVKTRQEDLLVKGVKLVMKITEDSVMPHESGEDRMFFMAREDSQQVLISFTERVRNATGHEFMAVWQPDSLAPEMKNKGGQLYLTLQDFPENKVVQIDRVFPYLLGQMIPQILFALLLLLFSGFAFYFTFRSLRKQVELNVLRNEFVSNISHELKTPVSTVKVALEALQNYERLADPQTTRDYLAMAQAELNRLESLTQKVLMHSRLESGYLTEDQAEINLNELCQDVVMRMQPQAHTTHSSMSVQLPEHPVFIRGDQIELEGVLMNLLDNAMKYGGPNPDIRIGIETRKATVILFVEDHGGGIPEAFKKKVFDKFFRVPAHNKHNVKGHGLGLSYAALVMAHHGGSIVATDTRGGGARFELTFKSLRNEA